MIFFISSLKTPPEIDRTFKKYDNQMIQLVGSLSDCLGALFSRLTSMSLFYFLYVSLLLLYIPLPVVSFRKSHHKTQSRGVIFRLSPPSTPSTHFLSPFSTTSTSSSSTSSSSTSHSSIFRRIFQLSDFKSKGPRRVRDFLLSGPRNVSYNRGTYEVLQTNKVMLSVEGEYETSVVTANSPDSPYANNKDVSINNDKTNNNSNKGFSIPWLAVLATTDRIVNRARMFRDNFYIDFTAGSVDLSSSDDIKIYDIYPQIYSLDNIIFPPKNVTEPSPILIAHQMGKRAIKKLPAPVLLGALILIASELLQRKVNDEKSLELIPPVFQEALNNTAYELDTKLEILSSMRWDIDPFLQGEIENLQSQPLVVIDKYIVRDLLPKIDKELSLVLSKLVTDPQQVSQVTKQIKDLVKLGSKLILTAEPLPSRTLNTIIDEDTVNMMEQLTEKVNEKVDIVGSSIEKVVEDWNTLIEKISHIVRSDTIIRNLPETFTSKLMMLLPSLSVSTTPQENNVTSTSLQLPPASRKSSVASSMITSSTSSSSPSHHSSINPSQPSETPSIMKFLTTIFEEERSKLQMLKEEENI